MQPDNVTLTIGARIRDKDGGVGEYLYTLNVANVAPKVTLTASSPLTIAVGGTVSVTGSFTDPGTLDAPWTWSINWGDGSSPTSGTGTPGTAIPASHQYTTAGSFKIRLSVQDKDGDSRSSSALFVTVQ